MREIRGPEGRSVTWLLVSAFTQLAAEAHPSVPHQRISCLSICANSSRQRAATALTERLSEKYDKEFASPPRSPGLSTTNDLTPGFLTFCHN